MYLKNIWNLKIKLGIKSNTIASFLMPLRCFFTAGCGGENVFTGAADFFGSDPEIIILNCSKMQKAGAWPALEFRRIYFKLSFFLHHYISLVV
jgi:hypothetical protein